jgi:hypothetical protein
MSFDPKADTRAAVLVGSLAGAEIAPTPFQLRERAAIVRALRSLRAPLDLNATEFRYLVKLDGSIVPVRPIRVQRLRAWRRIDIRTPYFMRRPAHDQRR